MMKIVPMSKFFVNVGCASEDYHAPKLALTLLVVWNQPDELAKYVLHIICHCHFQCFKCLSLPIIYCHLQSKAVCPCTLQMQNRGQHLQHLSVHICQ